jgi:hypothetical protein
MSIMHAWSRIEYKYENAASEESKYCCLFDQSVSVNINMTPYEQLCSLETTGSLGSNYFLNISSAVLGDESSIVNHTQCSIKNTTRLFLTFIIVVITLIDV